MVKLLKIKAISFLILLASVSFFPDTAEAKKAIEIKGTCTKFSYRTYDHTALCKPGMLNIAADDKRVAFMFLAQDMIMSFSGDGNKQLNGEIFGVLPIDRVTFSKAGNVTPLKAVGSCKFRYPNTNEIFPIDCQSETSEGHFEASFLGVSQVPLGN